jgi:hypothetical protein
MSRATVQRSYGTRNMTCAAVFEMDARDHTALSGGSWWPQLLSGWSLATPAVRRCRLRLGSAVSISQRHTSAIVRIVCRPAVVHLAFFGPSAGGEASRLYRYHGSEA